MSSGRWAFAQAQLLIPSNPATVDSRGARQAAGSPWESGWDASCLSQTWQLKLQAGAAVASTLRKGRPIQGADKRPPTVPWLSPHFSKALKHPCPRILCRSSKHPFSDKALVFQCVNELGGRILKNAFYWAVWEVFVIVLNAAFLTEQLCITLSLPPDFTLNCGGVSHERLWATAWKGSHQCGSSAYFNQGPRARTPYTLENCLVWQHLGSLYP